MRSAGLTGLVIGAVDREVFVLVTGLDILAGLVLGVVFLVSLLILAVIVIAYVFVLGLISAALRSIG
jgi:hypothetical protein